MSTTELGPLLVYALTKAAAFAVQLAEGKFLCSALCCGHVSRFLSSLRSSRLVSLVPYAPRKSISQKECLCSRKKQFFSQNHLGTSRATVRTLENLPLKCKKTLWTAKFGKDAAIKIYLILKNMELPYSLLAMPNLSQTLGCWKFHKSQG